MANARFEVTKGSERPLEVTLTKRRGSRPAYLACALVLGVAALYAIASWDGVFAAIAGSTWGTWQRNRIEASQQELMHGCAQQGSRHSTPAIDIHCPSYSLAERNRATM
jgi:hypothetical protein